MHLALVCRGVQGRWREVCGGNGAHLADSWLAIAMHQGHWQGGWRGLAKLITILKSGRQAQGGQASFPRAQ